MKRAEKKGHLVSVALELFNEHGYHAVGIDQIIAKAGIAKTTLYRHFKSKEELIIAVLSKVDRKKRDAMRTAVETDQKQYRLIATFDFLKHWFESADFYGCPFMGAAKEYCDSGSSVRHEAAMHKRLMLAFFEELAREDGYEQPETIAARINLLHEGATAVAQISRDSNAALTAKNIAIELMQNSQRPRQIESPGQESVELRDASKSGQ